MAFSNLEKLFGLIIGIDVAAPGTTRKALEAALARVIPAAAPRAPAAAGITGSALAGPAALIAGEIATGYAAAAQAERDAAKYGAPRIPIPFLYNPMLGDMPTVPMPDVTSNIVTKTIKRKASKFNKAVSAGMKAVRSSKFMGKKGKISNSKKAFATVTRTVSALKKGRKRPTKGVRGTIARAARRYI